MDIPIFTLYKDNNASFDNNDKHHNVKSNSLIKKNSIILIEHCFCENNDQKVMMSLIKNHEFLFDSLHPRTIKWTDDIRNREDDEIKNILHQKLESNCFGSNGIIMLGNEVSYFNHSNEPNCKVYAKSLITAGITTRIVFVVSLKDIEPNEELFIEYNKTIKFGNEEKNVVENITNLYNTDDKFLNSRYVKQLCKTHIGKDTFINVMINQKCAHSGLYICRNFIGMTSRFVKIYEETIGNKFKQQQQEFFHFVNHIEKELRNKIYEFLCNDVCILVPSHICYDLQLKYLAKCLESLLSQNKKVDIYVSISYENKYKDQLVELVDKFKMEGIIFNVENVQKYQMEHIYLLSKIIESKYYDLILFCDDDDTYEPNRIEHILFGMYYSYLNIGKEKIKQLGGIREYIKDEDCPIENQIPEYWAYGIKQCILEKFFSFFKNNMELLKHIFSDEYFRMYLRNNKEYSEWASIDNTKSKPLYNYNITNPDSICGKIEQMKVYTDEIHKNNLLLYTIHCKEKQYQKYAKDNNLKDKINIIFPEREKVISIVNKMYDVKYLCSL